MQGSWHRPLWGVPGHMQAVTGHLGNTGSWTSDRAGNGGLASSHSDRWAWRRGQQWLCSLLDFIADVETLMEGLLNLQPGPTRGDWYSKGNRLVNALRQVEEVGLFPPTISPTRIMIHSIVYGTDSMLYSSRCSAHHPSIGMAHLRGFLCAAWAPEDRMVQCLQCP